MNNSSETSRVKNRVAEAFQILITALLSLLLPLSFLLLARITAARYLGIPISHNHNNSFTQCSVFLFFTSHPFTLQLLISLVALPCLACSLTCKFSRHHLLAAWILLFAYQICVGLGLEGSIACGVEGSVFGEERNFISRLVLFLGMHETTLFWSRVVVEPVVEDTFFGFSKGEGWAGRAAMGLSLGGLWWWHLREEVEVMVVVPEMMGVGAVRFVGWWLYYSTVAIGVVAAVRGLVFTVCFVGWSSPADDHDQDQQKHNIDQLV